MGNKDISRRDFIKLTSCGAIGLSIPSYVFSQEKPQKIIAKEFSKLPSTDYYNVAHNEIEWKSASEGLDFSRTEVYRNKELVDIIATVKINPEKNKIKVFNGYNSDKSVIGNIEKWQEMTKATAMINSAQYQGGEFYYKPCALVLGNSVSLNSEGGINCKLKRIGPTKNKAVSGMLVSEPKINSMPEADLLDFKYDSFDLNNTPYTNGVQHWPILLDREGNIRVNSTLWQANRTVVAKTKEKEILFMTTEGGYFTLHNFGRFLKDSNKREDKGFNVHTAMNMDGGYEANMIVKSPSLEYLTYGEFETYGPGKDATSFGLKMNIPGVIGVFPRD